MSFKLFYALISSSEKKNSLCSLIYVSLLALISFSNSIRCINWSKALLSYVPLRPTRSLFELGEPYLNFLFFPKNYPVQRKGLPAQSIISFLFLPRLIL